MIGKRQRTPISFKAQAPTAATKSPPAHFLNRTCRLRLVQQSESWLTGLLLNYSGPDKQTCEIVLESADAAAPRRVEKVHLSTQPVHVLNEVAWGPEKGANSAEGMEAATAGGGRGDDLRGGPSGSYAAGLVPMLLFAPLGPPEFDGEAGQILAQSLETGEHVWVRREGTRRFSTHMLRRRTSEQLKKAVEAAIEHEKGLQRVAAKAAKKVVNKRIAVYWPDDDAWYFGVIEAWDAKEGKHRILYDDGCDARYARTAHPLLASGMGQCACAETAAHV